MPLRETGLKPTLDPERGGRRAVPTILQMEMGECGAAALAMILAHHGKWVSLEELRVRCGISRDGSRAVNVLHAARDLGLIARGARYEPGRLLELPVPLILFWNFNHFVVLEGVTWKGRGKRAKRYWLNDPARGRRVVSEEEFDGSYTGVCLAFQRGEDFEPGGRPPRRLQGLLSRLGHARSPLTYALLAAAGLIIPGLAFPTLVKVFIDEVLIPASESLLAPLLVALGVTAAVQAGLTWLQQICLARMETKLATVATSRFFTHLVRLPPDFFAARAAGDLANRVASNDKIARMICGDLANSVVNMLSMVAYGGVMLAYDLPLALAAFVMLSANVAALAWVSRRREEASRLLLKEEGVVAGLSVHGLSMIEALKSDASEARFFARWTGVHTNAVAARQRLGVISSSVSVVPKLVASFTTVTILGLGGLRIVDGALTIGGLVAFQMLSRRLAKPVEGLVRFGSNLQVIQADIARVDDVLRYSAGAHDPLQLEGEDDGGGWRRKPVKRLAAPPAERVFTLEDVTFGYSTREKPIIENVSLEITPGKRVALVGGSGTGKTTIAKLACGLLQPWSGSVRISGCDIAELPPGELASTIAYVGQDIVLFAGSVKDNVTLWNPAIQDRAVTQALRDAELLDEVMARPAKYDAEVGENGHLFSGGQRQLLELARAFATEPDILVLDEASAALDPITELRIDDRLRQRGCSCLIVAHRLSTIRDADEIIVLDQGRAVERGTHRELMAERGIYAGLMEAGA